jgi:hypothetical protein
MNNQDKIREYIKNNPNCLNANFGYFDVLKVAKRILDATDTGKNYATLRFLQEYCTPVNISESSFSDFLSGDPRKYSKLGNVRNEWIFVLSEKSVISNNVSNLRSSNNSEIISSKADISTSDYSGLILFIVDKLSKHNEPTYRWSFSVKDRIDWLNDDLRKGDTLIQSNKVLTIAGSILKYALDCYNEKLCFEAVRLIMDWGGVYYPLGPRNGNQKKIEELYKNKLLLEKVLCDYYRLSNESTKNIIFMNAGWTKVWSVLFPNRFIMFDSRVSFAITNLLCSYCKNGEMVNDYYAFPLKLEYRQIRQNHRYVDGFYAVNNNPVNWAKSMIVSSRILISCLSYSHVQGINISRYEPDCLRSVEARLFMMGA